MGWGSREGEICAGQQNLSDRAQQLSEFQIQAHRITNVSGQ